MKFSILYRGPLSSCNFSCRYCPFAKRNDTKEQLLRDETALTRFSTWLQQQSQHQWKVLFTPWGEALIRRWYRDTLIAFTHLDHIETVAIQTNFSCGLDWITNCQLEKLIFWATYHPTEVEMMRFVKKVQEVYDLGVRISVGMVGVPEFLDEIVRMRDLLPKEVYLWINAQQPRPRAYTAEEVSLLSSIDPQFELSNRQLTSLGKACQTGEVSFTIDNKGDMRRCHFVDAIIGNIYDLNWEQALRPRLCPNRYCNCYLGKSQLQADSLTSFFGHTALERLPKPDWRTS